MARRNVAETYKGLALTLPGSRLQSQSGFTCVTGGMGLSFGDFAAGFCLTGDGGAAVDWLTRTGRRNGRMWVYCGDTDEPGDLERKLTEAGFQVRQRLVQMVWLPRPVAASDFPLAALNSSERRRIADFAVQQFFGANSRSTRKLIARATAESPHALYGLEVGRRLVAAVMVVPTPGCLGLYNLCVARELRGKGLGHRLVQAVQAMADRLDVPLVLQCDSELASWYQRAGFSTLGELSALSWPGPEVGAILL